MNTINTLRIAVGNEEVITRAALNASDVLDSLYAAIGCSTVQSLTLSGGIAAIFDEEGKLTGAAPNPCATLVAHHLGHEFLPDDYLAGATVFIGVTNDGDYAGLTDTQEQTILRAIINTRE